MRPLAASALLTGLVLLAGCTESQTGVLVDPIASDAPGALPTDIAAPTDPGAQPTWAIGDWWTYRVEFLPAGLSTEMTIVVYGEDGGHWLLTGNDRSPNIQAEFSHYPTLGAWTKSDLEGTIHGASIPFFKWPLTDGKTWSDPYRGIPATWTAKAAKVATPGGAADGFDLSLVVEDGQYANYSYTSGVGWFVELEQGFGAPAVTMTLIDYGHAYAGEVSVLRFVEHLHRPLPVVAIDPGATTPVGEPVQRFTVGPGSSLAWGFYYGGAPGAYSFSFRGAVADAGGLGVTTGGQKTDPSIDFEWGELVNAPPGEWVAAGGGVAQGFGFAFGEILEVHEG